MGQIFLKILRRKLSGRSISLLREHTSLAGEKGEARR
jgi:hypothetical protein